MNTPTKITRGDLLEAVASWTSQSCEFKEGKFCCLTCGARIVAVEVKYSEHGPNKECSGFGQVISIPIPYCPTCEQTPEDHACVHAEVVEQRWLTA